MENAWKHWLAISKKLIGVQADIILVLFYFICIVPLSLVLQLFFKNALLGHNIQKKKNSYWINRKKRITDINWAKEL